MKRLILALAAALALGGLPAAAFAAQPAIYTAPFSNLAVGGYDTVSYFTGRPVKGSALFQTSWKGATWQFANAADLAKFKANPAAYAPQYGGYCAWAVADGHTAKGDPLQWKIVGGKLYLNYDAAVQAKWVKDIPGFIKKADANWPAVLK
ncbi:YHS domain-containing protein [Caulobacter ginsengisoli]|uniref:YHS domain-containing protein n=1 Tax=Caulobacter ginsengisoli TaxID=400775 RepID=A0ABU0IRV5_9CAUL|nr:YHS domain-containing (seleno)protein [Caulobacter ginsengisoli]MDQ0463888.1 YHS domain-containing protein [Caulobacter ginsengisoli]